MIKSKFILLIPISFIVLLSPPFVISNAFDIIFYKEIIVISSIFICVFSFNKNFDKNDYIIINLLLVSIVYSLLSIFTHSDSEYSLDFRFVNIAIQFSVTLITYLFFLKYFGIVKLCKLFILMMNIISILTIISFFLILLGILQPFNTFINPDGRTAYNYIIQYTNVIQYSDVGSLIRPAGFFDEPGTLAFILINAIFINFLTTKSKISEIILIFAGILTTSIAFYIILSLYFFIVKRISLKFTIIILIIIFILYFLIDNNMENPFFSNLYALTFGRFHISSDLEGSLIAGDNRSSELRAVFEMFAVNPLLGSGFLEENTKTSIAGFDSFLELGHPLIFHGMIGYFIYSLIPIYSFIIAYKSKNFKLLAIIFLVFLNYLQRPSFFGSGLYGLIPIMLFYGFLYFIKTNENIDNWR